MAVKPEFIEENMKVGGKPIKLYDYQREILEDDSEIRIINKARQIGITTTIALEALCYCIANDGIVIGIVSVSERQAKNVLQTAQEAYESLPEDIKGECMLKYNTKQEMVWKSGSRLISLPNNPRSVRGYPFDRLYLDEFAHMQGDKEMSAAIIPTTIRKGKITYISTPLGKRGEFYRVWTSDSDKIKKTEIMYTRCPDIMPRIDMIAAQYGGKEDASFRQEFCCEFIDDAISFFPIDMILGCVDDSLEQTDDLAKTRNIISVGVDFGKVVDSSVVIICEKKSTGVWEVKYIKEFQLGTTYTEVTDYIKRNYKKWNPMRIVVDQTGVGEKIIEDLSELGALVRGEKLMSSFKEIIITRLKTLMQDNRIRIPRDRKLINQLHSLKRVLSEAGNIRYHHPKSGEIQHDDYVWALALAIYQGETGSAMGGLPINLKHGIFSITRSYHNYDITQPEY